VGDMVKLRDIIRQLEVRIEFLEEMVEGAGEEEALEYGDVLDFCLIDAKATQARMNIWN
jgi:hypothetical protein